MELRGKLQGLEWLVEEVEASLHQACGALEAFLGDPTDESEIRSCLGYIHQIHGSLKIAGCNGPLLLAEEMEQLAEQLLAGSVNSVPEACQVLVQAILRLPAYLRQVMNTCRDQPETLLALFNELRAVRGKPLASETTFFTPQLPAVKSPSEFAKKQVDPEALNKLVKRLRQIYQYAVLGLVKGEQVDQNLGYIDKVLSRLNEIGKGTVSEPLWQIALALIDGLRSKDIPIGISVKVLFRDLDGQMKQLANTGIDALYRPLPTALLKNMLFYIAYGGSEEPRSQVVRDTYGLDQALHAGVIEDETGGLSPVYHPDAANAIVGALDGEFEQVKEIMDRYIVEGATEIELLNEAVRLLQRIADSLAVVGRLSLRETVVSASKQLESFTENPAGDARESLLPIAAQLVGAESELHSWLGNSLSLASGEEPQLDIGDAQESLLREASKGLERVKESIVEFIASQWNKEFLKGCPELLSDVRGALEMMSLPRAARILQSCNSYLVDQLVEGRATPEWSNLDAMADAITSVEYYLEFIGRDDVDGENTILKVAEQSVAGLGYPADGFEQREDSLPMHEDQVVPAASPGAADQEEAEESFYADSEIIDIFVEEVAEVLEEIDQRYPEWLAEPQNSGPLESIRRGFHTLKGSGRMVGALNIGELAWSVENLLNKILDNHIVVTPTIMALVGLARTEIPSLTEIFRKNEIRPESEYIAQLIEAASALAKGGEVILPSGDAPPVADNREQEQEQEQEDPVLLEIFAGEARVHLGAVDLFVQQQQEGAPVYSAPTSAVQRALHTLKGSARMAAIDPIAELVAPLESFIKDRYTYQLEVDEDIVQLLADAVAYVGEGVQQISAGAVVNIPRLDQFLARLAELRARGVAPILKRQREEQGKQVDPEFLNYLMTEGMQKLLDADTVMQQWQQCPGDITALAELQQELSHLEEAAGRAGVDKMVPVASLLVSAYQNIIQEKLLPEDDIVAVLEAGHELIMDMTNMVAANQELMTLGDELGLQILELASRSAVPDIVESPQVTAAQPEELAEAGVDIQQAEQEVTESEVAEPEVAELAPLAGILPVDGSDIDLDILEIFIAEADELLEEIDHALNSWEQDWSQKEPVETLKRALHTLKGGARMAGLSQLGDLSHDMEAGIIDGESCSSELSDAYFALLQRYQDHLLRALDKAKKLLFGEDPVVPQEAAPEEAVPEYVAPEATLEAQQPGKVTPEEVVLEEQVPAEEMLAEEPLEEMLSGEMAAEEVASEHVALEELVPEEETPEQPEPEELSPEPAVTPELPKQVEEMPAATAMAPKVNPMAKTASEIARSADVPSFVRRAVPQEMVKVPAPSLENLVNLAGETSIARGRIEQQISEFSFTIEEMGSTIGRLKDQVRRIGIETDAQVMFRKEQIKASDTVDGFDPLEMDRYSQLQQLSRALLESASDLQDLKDTLGNKSRDAETQLLEQSRINTDLQEGLMRTRMVPVSRLIPRLRRIVRQVSEELGKQVELNLTNVDGDMDRSVMEQILAPLEHMIRNSVDHGVESSEERLRQGKQPRGTVSIGFVREGADILIQLADDGAGLNLKAIRQRAVELNLIHENAELSEQEITQFIFHSGFSTSETVTQVSGRGVGMDVVNSQVRQLGGSIQISTTSGEGTQFTVRLPFTVSVNRALMIEIGEDLFALPLNTIDGVVRVSPKELEHYYRFPEARLEYGEERYEVRYLGSLLRDGMMPKIDAAGDSVFLVLVHSETRYFAVQVDALVSSDEIVVKSLGPQFSTVPGLSGATVFGDGRVVVILDLLALLRAQAAMVKTGVEILGQSEEARLASSVPTVMVVDDSVTVRKVTGRFLEREGFNVITARDGVDALRLLQEHTPDVMLLDIEMPRMDGFEVAQRVKSNSTTKEIPIIMITSRTGEKHRERALTLGVENYLGKPYQEEELLEAITEQIGITAE